MTKAVKSSALIVVSLWVGLLFCLGFIVAPYLFTLAARNSAAVPNTGVAADLIGPLLYSSDIIGLVVCAVLLLALTLLRRRGEVPLGSRFHLCELGVGTAAVCAAINYFVLTPRLKAVQAQLVERYGAFHLADKTDALLTRFAGLHQTSTGLFIAGFLAGLVCLVCMSQFVSRSSQS